MPGMSRMLSACASSQASPTCAGVAPSRARPPPAPANRRRPSAGRETLNPGEIRNECDATDDAPVEHTPVVASEQAGGVLDTGDLRRPDRLVNLVQRRRRDADAANLAFVAQRHHLGELVGERHALSVGHPPLEPPQVHRAELLDAERAQVVLHPGAEVGRRLRRLPTAGLVAHGANLGHDDEVIWVRMQRLTNQLVGHVRAVVLGGVDVVDAGLDSPPQHSDRFIVIARWTLHPRAGKLHRSEADPPDQLA